MKQTWFQLMPTIIIPKSSYIKNIAKSTSLPSTLFHDSIPANSDSAKANAFNNYFHSVFNQDLEYHSYIDHSASTSSLSKINISDLDVYDVLVGLDTTKAMGPDGIPPIVLSTCASASGVASLALMLGHSSFYNTMSNYKYSLATSTVKTSVKITQKIG